MGTGYDGVNRLNDFWEYDPSANTWTRKADFACSARYDVVSLADGPSNRFKTTTCGLAKSVFASPCCVLVV